MQPKHRNTAGFSFAELAFAMAILVTGAVVLGNHLAVNYQTTNSERDRVFAYSKAQAILAEVQAFVDRGQVNAAVDLDVLDDGIVNKETLSIQRDALNALVAPDHVVSGNYRRDAAWQWARRITVQPFLGLNNRNVRYVTVRIFRKDREGEDRPMADLSAVINSAGSAFPTTQVFDVYLLAVENIPGWWVFMDSIRPFVESMVTDLENRNPGLVFRTHWITKAAFGRNALYRPYTNDETDSYAAIPDVYTYPGRMPGGNASSYYFVPDNIRARINADGTERNGYDSSLNPHPYALADFFNHAMRYPEELALWEARVQDIETREAAIASAVAGGSPPPAELTDMSKEPTLRLFLEDLCTSPTKYKNALVINLHGELLPMPALRNYSDAAKSQATHQHLRVVTHPEELRTKRNDGGVTDSMQFRIYAYGHRTSAASYSGPAVMTDPMAVEFVGINLTDPAAPTKLASTVTLLNVPGGPVIGTGTSATSNYATTWQIAKHASGSLVQKEMFYEAEWVAPTASREGFTRVFLYNTPTACPPVTQSSLTFGLANSTQARLYQLEYIPCPLAAGPAFTPDLTYSGAGPKNTARWTLRVDPAVLTNNSFVRWSSGGQQSYNPAGDVMMTVRTRIATDLSGGSYGWQNSGTISPTPIDPDNLSVTYSWWANSKEDVPITERAQFNGDPRHVPYKDCFNGGDDYPNSYNWYHDNLANGTSATGDFPCIAAANLRNHFGSGQTACDTPRYFELLRTGLVKSGCVYTTLTGWSYYYLGIGNDVGYDSANGYPNSIPTNLVPYGSTGNGYVNTIIGARNFVRAGGSNYWWGMPWLGELFPDDAYAAWTATTGGTVARGNLPAGAASGSYYQAACQGIYAGGTRAAQGTTMANSLQRASQYGCTTFFNIGTSSSTFQHTGASGNGTLTSVGNELAANYNMTMPAAAPISRPFGLTWSTGTGEHWDLAPYSTGRYSASLFRTYYTHSSGIGSGLVKLVNPAADSAGYVVVNGISNAVDNGTTFISKFSVLSLVHSFFEAGSTTNTLRIPQLPRLQIESPTDITELDDPSAITIQYSTAWKRWDGLQYAQSGNYTESEALLRYVIMYSNDNGTTWRHISDDAEATLGQLPTNPAYVVADSAIGNETRAWSVPSSSFPEGSYLLRIDCYRQGASVHYSFHQTKIFIQR